MTWHLRLGHWLKQGVGGKVRALKKETLMDIPRQYHGINWRGLGTLCYKETLRFFDSWSQTILGPAIGSLLFLAVFELALGGGSGGGATRMIGQVRFIDFLVPGLIVMSMAQNAFANSSFSILVSKVQGNIVDVLMPPLGAVELAVGYTVGGIARGLTCGTAVALGMAFFVPLHAYHPASIVFSAVFGSMMLSLFGVIAGVVSVKFDHIGSVTNFIVSPLAFLSGTFYSVQNLPAPFHEIALWNPFFYMIDGFRYGMTGHSDGDPLTGMGVLFAMDVFLAAVVYLLLRSGYKM
jgi:ABC-2 type transport system permease protein